MGGNIDKENYSTIGFCFPFGYIERDKENFNIGLNLSASTPLPGPYGETGGYAEVSWNGKEMPSMGVGTYDEVGVSGEYMGFGVYGSSGNCYDSRNKREREPPKFHADPRINLNSLKPCYKCADDDIARRVYRGEYGNGQERKNRLEKEGYNYSAVQKRVNKIYYSKK